MNKENFLIKTPRGYFQARFTIGTITFPAKFDVDRKMATRYPTLGLALYVARKKQKLEQYEIKREFYG